MKRLLVLIAVFACSGATPALGAVTFPVCCACLQGYTGQKQAPIQQQALICSLVSSTGGISVLEQECALAGGSPVQPCFEVSPDTTSCNSALFDEGISCPSGAPGAPAVGPYGLLALAALLAAFGSVVLRRRRT